MHHTLFDFTQADAVSGWAAIDDRVMGGLSRSRLRHDAAGHAVFEGTVSLAQNGGFASVRSASAALGVVGAPSATCCLIEARGSGQTFKLCLFTDGRFDSVSYQAAFTPSATAWEKIALPLAAFTASFRGRAVADAAALDAARIRQCGLMVAGRQAGDFALQVRSIGLA